MGQRFGDHDVVVLLRAMENDIGEEFATQLREGTLPIGPGYGEWTRELGRGVNELPDGYWEQRDRQLTPKELSTYRSLLSRVRYMLDAQKRKEYRAWAEGAEERRRQFIEEMRSKEEEYQERKREEERRETLERERVEGIFMNQFVMGVRSIMHALGLSQNDERVVRSALWRDSTMRAAVANAPSTLDLNLVRRLIVAERPRMQRG